MWTAEKLSKEWKKLLIDSEISETEFFKRLGLKAPTNNPKIKTGRIKFLEFAYFLNELGYDLQIVKKDTP